MKKIVVDGAGEMTPGTLAEGEIHPSASSAMKYVRDYLIGYPRDAAILRESIASSALAGNRQAEVCSETLRRILNGEAVSDRYLLGLAWLIKNIREAQDSAVGGSTLAQRLRMRLKKSKGAA